MNYTAEDDYITRYMALLECNHRCAEFLARIKWPSGFQCQRCSCRKSYRLLEYDRYECAGCGYQASPTSGTIFHGTKLPLKKWFLSVLLFATDKGGISARRLEKVLEVNYKSAAKILRKLRSVTGKRVASLIKHALDSGLETILHARGRAPVEAVVVTTSDGDGSRKVCLIPPEEFDFPLPKRTTRDEKSRDRFAIAGVVALAKEFFLGTYHRASYPKYRQMYFDEFAYRYNWKGPAETLELFFADCVHSEPWRRPEEIQPIRPPSSVSEPTAEYRVAYRFTSRNSNRASPLRRNIRHMDIKRNASSSQHSLRLRRSAAGDERSLTPLRGSISLANSS